MCDSRGDSWAWTGVGVGVVVVVVVDCGAVAVVGIGVEADWDCDCDCAEVARAASRSMLISAWRFCSFSVARWTARVYSVCLEMTLS